MRIMRTLTTAGYMASLLLACLLLGSGCGGEGSGSDSQTVKDAPLQADQQTAFDAVYKTNSKKKGRK